MNAPEAIAPLAAYARIPFESCPLCGSEQAELVKVADASMHPLYTPELPPKLEWIRCTRCAHVFVRDYFNDAALAHMFSGALAHQTPGHDVMRAREVSARIVEALSQLRPCRDGKWLDVGFGDGALITTASEFGYETTGLDLRPSVVESMRALGFDAHAVPIESFESAARFDVVSMADVLEHMPFPKQALTAARRLLADDGLLFVSMPNMDAFAWRDLDARGTNPYWSELEHVHNFGRARLYALLEEMGFEPFHYGISRRYVVCMEVIAKKR